MKKIVASAAILMMAMMTFGQGSAVDRVFDKYAGKDGYTTVYISSFMFNLMSGLDVDDPEYNEFKKATSGIKSMRILTQEGEDSQAFGKELLEMLPRKEYQELMKVKDGSEEVLMLAKQEGGKVKEFLMIVSGGGEDVLIAIDGEIDLQSLSSIASGLDLPGMENLEELDELP
jgi:hypothetical protein